MLRDLGEPSTSVFFFTGMVPEVPKAPSLIALDKTTGRLVARDDEQVGPRIFHCTWSSPALGQVNGRKLVFFCGGDGVVYIATMRKLYAVQRSAQ